jgi:hypothetical protein
MTTEDAGGEETPFAIARRLHAQGVSAEEVERELRATGLDGDEAAIAARAGRGEAGAASPVVRVIAEVQPELPPEPPAEAPTHPCPAHAAWPVTAICTRCGKFFCAQCLRDAGWVRLPDSKQCPTCEAQHPAVTAIGGWLVLPALHVTLVGPLSSLAGMVQDFAAISKARESVRAPVVIEFAFSAFVVAYSVYAAIAFHRRKRRAIGLMMGFYALLLGSQLLGFVLKAWIESILGTTTPHEQNPTVVAGLLSSVLWMTYFAQSTRVKNTFVVD